MRLRADKAGVEQAAERAYPRGVPARSGPVAQRKAYGRTSNDHPQGMIEIQLAQAIRRACADPIMPCSRLHRRPRCLGHQAVQDKLQGQMHLKAQAARRA